VGKSLFQKLQGLISILLVPWVLGVVLICPPPIYGQGRILEDALGRSVQVPFSPRRIVSLAPDITETLFALGLDSQIVGVTRFSNFPPAAQDKPKVGTYVDINTEAIVNLNPDLILGTGAGNSRIQVEKLERLGFSVFVVYPKNFDEILQTIHLIARVVGRKEEGETIVREIRHRTEQIHRLVRGRGRPLVFIQIGQDPIFTVSNGSFAHDLIAMAGGENIAKGERIPYPSYSLEEVILRSPEVIIISSMYVDAEQPRWLDHWKRWEIIPAVKNNRLHIIDSDLIDRPSPRIINGLEQLARIIHPEAFTE
jgi:iron complex transport system substrate-binding protein